MRKTKIVISGVNMVDSGILSIFQEMIIAFGKRDDVKVICLVNNKQLFSHVTSNNIKYIEFSHIKKSWLNRLFFEFITSFLLSKRIKADLWICLHDITANVITKKRFVYCHNPSPFYRSNLREFKLDKKFYLFSKFYKYLYKINIKKNSDVIVQQTWIADKFHEWFNVNDIIVSKPESTKISKSINDSRNYNREQLRLFYPAYPRVFKNIELLIDTMHFMKIHHPVYYEKIEIILTFDRGVSLYGDNMIRKARELELNNIHFSGFVSRDKVYEMYKTEADALIFPSKLETWGLPISEAKMFNLPIIVANFDYAHETIGDYPYAIFFENEKKELAHVLISFIDGKDNFSKTKKVYSKWNQCESYDELVSHMLNA